MYFIINNLCSFSLELSPGWWMSKDLGNVKVGDSFGKTTRDFTRLLSESKGKYTLT